MFDLKVECLEDQYLFNIKGGCGFKRGYRFELTLRRQPSLEHWTATLTLMNGKRFVQGLGFHKESATALTLAIKDFWKLVDAYGLDVSVV